MSWQASIWAATLPHKRVAHIPFRVLMLLADHAHDDGTATWRAISGLAATLEVSERTIYRALKELKDEGLIELGDQRLMNHLPENRRIPVYNLVMVPRHTQPTTLAGVDGPDGAVDNSPDEALTDLSPLTTGVKPSKEEPPLDITKELRASHTVPVSPADAMAAARADARLQPCPSSRSRRHFYSPASGYCACGVRDDGYQINLQTGRPV